DRGAVGAVDLFGHLVGGVRVDVDNGDPCPVLREPGGDTRPDALPGARHQRDSLLDARHAGLLSRWAIRIAGLPASTDRAPAACTTCPSAAWAVRPRSRSSVDTCSAR